MKEFKVKKGINKEPLLWGMTIPLFSTFMIVLVVCAFVLITGFSFSKIIFVLVTVSIVFFGFQALSRINVLKFFLSEKFPGQVRRETLKEPMTKLTSTDPFIFIEGNKAYTNNGSILMGYKIYLPEVYSLGEEDYDAMQNIWCSAFKNLPSKTIIHKQDIYLKEKFNKETLPGKSFLQQSTQKHFNGREYLKHHSFLYFTLPNHEILSSSFMRNPFKKPLKKKEAIEIMEKTNHFFQNEIPRCVEYINNSRKIKLESMTGDDLNFLESAYFNGFYLDQINDFDLKNLEVGDKKMGCFAIPNAKFLGERIATSVMDQKMSSNTHTYHQGFLDGIGIKLDCEHIFNQIIFIKDHKSEKSKIESSKQKLYGSRKFDKEYEVESKKLDQYLTEIADDEKIRLAGGHFNVIFYAENEKEKSLVQEKITTAFKNVDILPYYPGKENQKNLIANSFPGFVANIDTDNIIEPIDLQQLTCLLTNVTNYQSDDSGIWFTDRLFNIPVKKDIWDKEKKRIKARNFYILAPTGEGKSVLANHIFRQLYEDDVNIVIFDLGNSYRKLSLLYPGDTAYFRYKEGQGLGINPFSLENGEKVSTDKIEELAGFCFKMWKRERLPSDQESVSLRKLIDIYYKNSRQDYSFPDFYQFIEESQKDLLEKLEIGEFFNIKDFLLTCSEFVGDGIYAFLFQSENNTISNIQNKKIIVFELDEVKDKPVLLSLMLHLGSEVIRKLIWSDRKKRGVVFFDEFAKMLKFPSVLTTAEYFYQAIRKYEGAIGTVLQSPAQLPDNDIAKAMIDNTQVIYILQNTKGYDALIKRFNFSKHDQNQLNSLQNQFSGRIKYSEIGLMLGNHLNIVRVELSKEALLAYSSEGAEYEKIMEIYNNCGDMEKAIKKYMNYA